MKKVAIIGMGTMGTAIAQTLERAYELIALDQDDNLSRARAADIVILAVKPQSFVELSRDLKQYVDSQTVLSIMAGVSCQQLSTQLGTQSIVRTMPNLALAKAKSLTGAYSFEQQSPRLLDALLRLWGDIVWLEKEADFDAFTALAGSGPAYFFELACQLQRTAEELGFTTDVARQIANSTLVAAAAVIGDQSAAEKVAQVASKGGTTEAALAVLAEHDFDRIINQAVLAAKARSQELSS